MSSAANVFFISNQNLHFFQYIQYIVKTNSYIHEQNLKWYNKPQENPIILATCLLLVILFILFSVSNHQLLTSKVWYVYVRRHGTQEAAALFYLPVLTFVATNSNNQGSINHQKGLMPVRLLRGCHVHAVYLLWWLVHTCISVSIFLFVTRSTDVVN